MLFLIVVFCYKYFDFLCMLVTFEIIANEPAERRREAGEAAAL